MGVFLIFAVIAVVVITFLILISVAKYDWAYEEVANASGGWPYTKTVIKSKFWDVMYGCHDECAHYILIAITIIVCIVTGGLGISAAIYKASTDTTYERMQTQYYVLTDMLEEDNYDYHIFYEDICAYNDLVIDSRAWSDNFWIGWYRNSRIKDLPLIDSSHIREDAKEWPTADSNV